MLDERSVQTVLMPSNIFKNKENVESMLNESLNQFKFDSTRFQQVFDIFYAFNDVQRPVQTPPTFGSTTVLNACWSECWNCLNGPWCDVKTLAFLPSHPKYNLFSAKFVSCPVSVQRAQYPTITVSVLPTQILTSKRRANSFYNYAGALPFHSKVEIDENLGTEESGTKHYERLV